MGYNEFSFGIWLAEIKARAEDNIDWSHLRTSVYKAPAFLRERNPKAFTPEVVSFGPLHHGNPQLKPMEVQKGRVFFDFVRKANDLSLQNIMREVYKIIKELRDAYSFLDDIWKTDDEAFFKIMIVDGFFMLQILSLYGEDRPDLVQFFCIRHYSRFINKLPYIRRDMLLIENQLPLILLEALVPFLYPQVKDIKRHINSLVLNFVEAVWTTARPTLPGLHVLDLFGLHVLDLFRQSLFHHPERGVLLQEAVVQLQLLEAGEAVVQFQRPLLLCAVELQEAGVRFRKSKTEDLRDISFNPKSGVFHLPSLVVDVTLLNLIAFEHLHGREDQYVTTYVCLLDEIINSANDVSLLHHKEIILNKLRSSDDEVAMLFNNIAKEATMNHSDELLKMKSNIFQYCQVKRHRWKTNLINTYFKSPWSALSLAGALFVIVLTFIQTLYTIIGK